MQLKAASRGGQFAGVAGEVVSSFGMTWPAYLQAFRPETSRATGGRRFAQADGIVDDRRASGESGPDGSTGGEPKRDV